ncbi:MAG: cytochrome c3 family protein [Actinomycetota bacterium]
MTRRTSSRIPRIAGMIVTVFIVGVAALLVNVAWKSNSTIRAAEPTESVQPPAGSADDSFLGCTNCHGDLDKVFKQGRAGGLRYRHAKHFAKGVSDCSMCHPANAHEADKINKPTMTRCFICHGLTKTAIAPGKCITCHPANFPDKPASHLAATWKGAHGKESRADSIVCSTCHEERSCTACHGVKMPHAEGWKSAAHIETAFAKGLAVCQKCHPRDLTSAKRDFCDSCHHAWGPKQKSWLRSHPAVVKAGNSEKCFQCHQPATCAACHTRGDATFESDRKAALDRAAELRQADQTPSPSTTPQD